MNSLFSKALVVLLFLSALGCAGQLDALQIAPLEPAAAIANAQEQIEAHEKAIAELDSTMEPVRQQSDKLEHEIRRLQRLHFEKGISGEAFPDILRSLQTQRIQLTIDLAGLDARQKAILEYNASQSANPLVAEIIDLMESQVAAFDSQIEKVQQMYLNGVVSDEEIANLKNRQIDAKIQLQQTRLEYSGGLAASGDELRQIALQRAEQHARLEKTEELLQGLASAPDEFTSLERLEAREKRMMDQLLELEEVRRSQEAQRAYWKRQLEDLQKQQGDGR
jgi:chromosome segregation ATPase